MNGHDKSRDVAPYIDWGEPLPRSYAENRVVAMVCDPEHLFIYWDVATDVRVSGNPVVLLVHCLSESKTQHVESEAGAESWYLQVSPNRAYKIELYERTGNGNLRLLAASKEVSTPIRHPQELHAGPPAELVHAMRFPLARRARRQPVAVERHAAPTSPLPMAPTGQPDPLLTARSGGL